MAKSGQPKKFNSGNALIALFADFCDHVAEERDYAIVPSQTEFCKWLGRNYRDVTRRTIYNSLNKYFPTIKKEFEQLQGDLIAQGAMIGKYQNTMAIFALKNWCAWQDKPGEATSENEQQRELLCAIKKAIEDAD